MKILVIGGLGSIGSRYCAILKWLGIEYEILDIGMGRLEAREFDRAIIATPTETHYDYCKQLVEMGKPFLCEKPVSKDLKECEELAAIKNGYVVNNYEIIYRRKWNTSSKEYPPNISYHCYKTGKDGLDFDCSQLIYMAGYGFLTLTKDSPIWSLRMNGDIVTYKELEESYVWMIQAWLLDFKEWLWTMRDGYEMTKAVLEYEAHHAR